MCPKIYFKKLARTVVELASPKFVGQPSRLETQAGVDAEGLRQSCISGTPPCLLVRPSN